MRYVQPRFVGILLLLVCLTASGCSPTGPSSTASPPGSRQLLIVLDGLRPDYVTPTLMPALSALGQRGVVMMRHHAVFPTVTRVNASSIATGAYPEAHGIMGNSVFVPEVDPGRFLDTSDRANLLRIDAAGLPLLTAPTLGASLEAAGQRLLVASSGSSGSAFLLNHAGAAGATLHYEFGVPESLHAEAVDRLGPVPDAARPNHARNRWIVDGFLDVALSTVNPAVTVLWLSDPDTTAHEHGIGHPLTVEALFRLDAEIDRLLGRLDEVGLLESTNIWVTSDHGFSQHTGGVDLTPVLAPFDGVLEDGTPRIVASSGAIYVRDNDREVIAAIVAGLQTAEGIGAVFTEAASPGAPEGWVPGTLSFDLARWSHERSAHILYSADWTNDVGDYGFLGTTAQDGVAGHGAASPFDIQNTLVAAGPDLKTGVRIASPTGNVDFAPTFLHLVGLDVPPAMQGRVLREALRDDEAGAEPVRAEMTEVTVENADGSYTLTAVVSAADDRTYLDYTTVERR